MASSTSMTNLCVLSAVLVVLAMSAHVADAGVIGTAAACPAFGSGNCGLYKTSAGKPLLCGNCTIVQKNTLPAKICTWTTGKCGANTIKLGNPCTSTTVCPSATSCIADQHNPGFKRCCRTTACPPGLCGLAGIVYKTFCGNTINCPAKC